MSTVLLNLTDIAFTYFSTPILKGLDWEIQAGQKIGLIGPNGCGKSTLLKIILGQLAPETGAIFRVKGLTIGYLPQDMAAEWSTASAHQEAPSQATPTRLAPADDPTVLDVAMSGSPEIGQLRLELAQCEARMGDPAVYGAPARLAQVMAEHDRLLQSYEARGGLTYENRVRSTLRDLGLGDETFDQPMRTFSGGQAKLVGLARLPRLATGSTAAG